MASVVNAAGDLHVRVVSRRLVQASDESLVPRVLAVSNLDLLPQSMQVSMLCVYPKPSSIAGGFDFDDVASSPPSHFFPFAGRVVANPFSGLPEIHCNNQGAELVVGEVGVALASLDYGTMGASLRKIQLPHGKDVPLSVQVVSGGYKGVAHARAVRFHHPASSARFPHPV
ncbi:Os01g0262300 [Oryza sativa Japonica Group]|uniref:Os01g0262300 protein n=1 Tax=Oryza sativa subsp. japonica TaxID=39947 RepID=C7IXQ6_ORYSJ|nr:Os01g0262300 [Oryza sativa Japonica Group]|eukprot:NP_001172268.1 Os01g0262300 [Oryza sativa Japonica Group]